MYFVCQLRNKRGGQASTIKDAFLIKSIKKKEWPEIKVLHTMRINWIRYVRICLVSVIILGVHGKYKFT